MAEPKRKDEEVTAADLAGRGPTTRDKEGRPQLLRTDERMPPESAPRSPFPAEDRLRDPRDLKQSFPATYAGEPRVTSGAPEQPANDPAAVHSRATPLFSEPDVSDFRSRWSDIQTAFVDEPRRAVEDADHLVASLMKKLADGFAKEREGLEHQWDRGDSVSTEDLRIALQRYRAFFDRLLTI
jgi:hypothetical protein